MARNISEFVNDVGYITSAGLSQQYVKKSGDDMVGDYTITGNATISGSVGAAQFVGLSDARLKTDLVKIEDALQKVCKLAGYTYNLNGCSGRKAGVIAQDVAQVLPECVVENDQGLMQVDYNGLIALIIQSIHELNDKIESK